MRGPEGHLHVFFQNSLDLRLRNSPHDLVDKLPLLDNEHRWNRHYSEAARHSRILVRVKLPKHDLSRILLRQRINDRTDNPTGPTPRRPAVDNSQRIFLNKLVES